MNEIHITIRKVPDEHCSTFVRQLTDLIQDHDPRLQVDISVSDPFLWLTTRKGHFKLYFSKCHFIETDRRSLIFHCDGGILRKNGRISEILKMLPHHLFFRCNNSYIVNLRCINEIRPDGDRYSIRLRSGEIVPLSRSRYQECLAALGILQRQ